MTTRILIVLAAIVTSWIITGALALLITRVCLAVGI